MSNSFKVAAMSNDSISDDDKALFRQMMQGVEPLAHTKKLVGRRAPPPEQPLRKRELPEAPKTSFNLSNYYSEVVSTDSVLSYCKKSIPRKRLSQLKSGQIHLPARLDLHGFRPEAASDTLCQFIEHQSRLANRCLLVIHGKGSRNGEAPILKNHVNHWLKQMPQVLAFHSALARDGGTGAVYVLLQKSKVDHPKY